MLQFDPLKRIDVRDILDQDFFGVKNKNYGKMLKNASLQADIFVKINNL